MAMVLKEDMPLPVIALISPNEPMTRTALGSVQSFVQAHLYACCLMASVEKKGHPR
jgi:hypothetical protein